MKMLRQPTLDTFGLGNVIDIFKNGKLPVNVDTLVDEIFGEPGNRGAVVISGANGIVGAGKTMQLGSRLHKYGIPIIALDFPGASDGIGRQYQGLKSSFGQQHADEIMANVIRFNYDGKKLPSQLKDFNPRFLLEAIPEILDIKKKHYKVFQEAFPGVEIRSVTSGFPSSELGVGIAHPAFPHQINKLWEIVEETPSNITKLLWAIGLIPVPVSDNWSFVLDVLFCGLMLAGLRYHQVSNMPYWKIDKLVRKILGPNPFRAHDAIGAKGANFLTWSCLHHLSETYGELFTPTFELEYRKESGQNWYPLNHFRPVVNWNLSEEEFDEMKTWILGPMIQMTSLMLHENRGHLSHINAIGEICAQFRSGIIATIRQLGAENAIKRVEAYHKLDPKSTTSCWYPNVFDKMNEPEWQQLYVNAEHDGTVGLISINRESYNKDVDQEMNSAINWLKAEGLERVIVTGDFHLSTQLVGADTSDFYPALEDADQGYDISLNWSTTARRLHNEFKVSVGYLNGKRCLGGMLELMMHCHYLISTDDCQLGMPEVTLPVIPGMEGCHWPFRKAKKEDWSNISNLLFTGKAVKASDTVGWLVDFAGSVEDSITMAWKTATGNNHGLIKREVVTEGLHNLATELQPPDSADPVVISARKAIMECVNDACQVPLSDAIVVQAKHSAAFMSSKDCRHGVIGTEAEKVLNV